MKKDYGRNWFILSAMFFIGGSIANIINKQWSFLVLNLTCLTAVSFMIYNCTKKIKREVKA